MLVVLRRDARRVFRWLAGISTLLIVGGLAVSLSRASWMGAIAGVLCISLFSHGEQRRRAITYSGVLIVGALLVASAWYGPAIATRFTSILHPTASTVRTSAGDKTRQVDWNFALKTFEENPVLGVGIGNLAPRYQAFVAGSGLGTHASDVYLQYLAEGGVFGGAALLLLAGAVSVDLFRARRTDWLYPGLAGAFVGVGVTWVTDFTVRYYAVAGCLAILIGLAASGPSRPAAGVSPASPAREGAVLV
jgi:O-antigen ligase